LLINKSPQRTIPSTTGVLGSLHLLSKRFDDVGIIHYLMNTANGN